MFTGICIGVWISFWVYAIFLRHKEYDETAFNCFLVCCVVPGLIYFLSWLAT